MVTPSRDDFLRRAQSGMRVPVVGERLSDFDTPLSVYWKLAHEEANAFLLESVTGGEHLARFSFISVRPEKVFRSKGPEYSICDAKGKKSFQIASGQDPIDILKSLVEEMRPDNAKGLPRLCGGAVGLLGYELVRFFEQLPQTSVDDLQLDDVVMMLCGSVVVFDHAKNLIRVIILAEPNESGYSQATKEIERIFRLLNGPLPELPTGRFPVHPMESNLSQEDFEAGVERAKDYIRAGDGIQFVLSQRFSTRFDAHPITAYRALRSLNPSPYMFLLHFEDFDLVGASPEILVGLENRTAHVRPIAGTRRRGDTPEEDAALEEELLGDQKERAEHLMLVDLGRNDLGRVATTGSVNVNAFMVIEKYSHVMHIVSDVSSELSDGLDAADLIRATFPAGTVSGAPKVRAMEIIEEIEPTRRGSYAGAIGYWSANGDTDFCIAIRTILIKDGRAHVQAGAGIVYDSDKTSEFYETEKKAEAALRAIALAQEGLER